MVDVWLVVVGWCYMCVGVVCVCNGLFVCVVMDVCGVVYDG